MKKRANKNFYISFFIALLIHIFLLQNINFDYEIKEENISEKILSITVKEIVKAEPSPSPAPIEKKEVVKKAKEEKKLEVKPEKPKEVVKKLQEKYTNKLNENNESEKDEKDEKIEKNEAEKIPVETETEPEPEIIPQKPQDEIMSEVPEVPEVPEPVPPEINKEPEKSEETEEIVEKEVEKVKNNKFQPNMAELLKMKSNYKPEKDYIKEKSSKINKSVKKPPQKQIENNEIKKSNEIKKNTVKNISKKEIKKKIERVDFSKIANKEGYQLPGISSFVKPEYPDELRKREVEGQLKLKVLIDIQGKVKELEIIKSSGFEKMDNAALKAVKEWKFSPGKKDKKTVESIIIVPISFKISN